jgi:nucleoside-diphosphate-sugar epimerase
MTTLITGAAGFVGRNLGLYLATRHPLRLAVRELSAGESLRSFGEVVAVGNVCSTTDWTESLKGVHAVVHLANRAHVLRETAMDPATACREVNVEGTRRVAEQAVAAGVRRLVYLSSVKVLGERTQAQAFYEGSLPAPEDPYGESKRDAEKVLHDIAARTGLEVVVLRPPLVYGPGVKANFLRLMQWVHKGWPLPLGAIRNRRSLLYLGNLVDAIRLCVEHPAAAGQTFLLDDGEVVSTPDLIRAVAHAMGRTARLLAVPVRVIEFAGVLLGKRAAVARLTGSLCVDSSLIRSQLNWTPPYSMEAGLAATVASLQ